MTIHYIVLFRSMIIERDLLTLLYIFLVHVMCISNRKILKFSYPNNIKSKVYTVYNSRHTCQTRTTLMLLNTTFNNISVIMVVSFIDGGPRENHDLSQVTDKLSHNVVHLTLIEIWTHNISGDRYWFHR